LEKPYKILIIRLSSIGDIILTTALIRCVRLKYPEVQIDFMVKKQFLETVVYNPHISNVLVFEKGQSLKEFKNRLKLENYDWLIDIHQNFRSLFLKTGLKIPLKTGYSKQLFHRTLLVYLGKNIYGKAKPVLLRYFEAVEKQGVKYDNAGTEVFFTDQNMEKVKQALNQSGYTSDKNLFVLCPGASFSNKRWLPERFAAVAEYLVKNKNGWIAFIGGKNDRELCAEIQSSLVATSANFAGEFSLLDSAALLSECVAFVGNDSGMLHLAQAFKKSVVGIYGPTVKELGYFPIPEKSVVVEKAIPCRPCTHNGLNKCPKKHFNCMNTISSENVVEALESLLK